MAGIPYVLAYRQMQTVGPHSQPALSPIQTTTPTKNAQSANTTMLSRTACQIRIQRQRGNLMILL
jgi:hypothetical protein